MSDPAPWHGEDPPNHAVAVILGVPIDALTMEGVLGHIEQLVARGRHSGRTHQIATVNVDFVVNAVLDEDLLRLLQHTDLALADGMPVVWGGRALGCAVPERVAGADLVPTLAAHAAAERGLRLYLLGGRPGVAERAAAQLREANPKLHVTADPGPVDVDIDAPDPGLIAQIREADPDICCVAFGNPKQERWIERWRDDVGVPVFIGIGGTLDFLAGVRRRAPGWSQRIGGEWIHRMLTEPRRLTRRYARDIVVFGPRFVAMWWRFRADRGSLPTEVVPAEGAGGFVAVIRRGSSLGDSGAMAIGRAAERGLPLVVTVHEERRIDARALATIVQLQRIALWHGIDVETQAPAAVRRQLATVGVHATISTKRAQLG